MKYFNKNEEMKKRRSYIFEKNGYMQSDKEINEEYELNYYKNICKKLNIKSNDNFFNYLNNENYSAITLIHSQKELMKLFENGNILNDDHIQHIIEAEEELDILKKEIEDYDKLEEITLFDDSNGIEEYMFDNISDNEKDISDKYDIEIINYGSYIDFEGTKENLNNFLLSEYFMFNSEDIENYFPNIVIEKPKNYEIKYLNNNIYKITDNYKKKTIQFNINSLQEAEYTIYNKEDRINNLIIWIAESDSENDKILMKEDLKLLFSIDDDYILVNNSNNEIITTDILGNFNNKIKNILIYLKKQNNNIFIILSKNYQKSLKLLNDNSINLNNFLNKENIIEFLKENPKLGNKTFFKNLDKLYKSINKENPLTTDFIKKYLKENIIKGKDSISI